MPLIMLRGIYSDRYKGKFDQGWDALREEVFARQKQMGVIPGKLEARQMKRSLASPSTSTSRWDAWSILLQQGRTG